MAPNVLPKDATIADVLETLSNPEEYVRVVLGHLSACRREHSNASVRIGITGTGQEPSHMVVYHDANGDEVTLCAFGGRLPFTEVSLHVDTWSTVAMTFEHVQKLLGEIRGFGGVAVRPK
jgi:hypothetical protein